VVAAAAPMMGQLQEMEEVAAVRLKEELQVQE
jgi:hypothetical protein